MNNSTLERNVTLTMDGTSQGLVLQYDKLTVDPKTFTITHNGINYKDNTNNDTTSLQRLAQVQQLFQAVVLPPDSTTLQINNRLLLQDPAYNTVSGSMSVDSGGNVRIDASGNLILNPLNPLGTINASGKTINIGGGQIHNCGLINSQNNNDITIQGSGTGNIILRTGDTDRLTISDTGAWTCDGSLSYASGIMSFPSPPTCTIPATTTDQLVNFNNFIDTSGSWIPTISGASTPGTPSYTSQIGRYIRINNFCCFQAEIAIDASGSMAGQIRLSVPFTCNATIPGSVAIGLLNNLSTETTAAAIEFGAGINAGETYVSLVYRPTSTSSIYKEFDVSKITNSFIVRYGGVYIVA
jgi:hypothetical protein